MHVDDSVVAGAKQAGKERQGGVPEALREESVVAIRVVPEVLREE